MNGFRRIGTAALARPRLDGYEVWGVYGTRPHQLAVYPDGWLDFAGTLHRQPPEWMAAYARRTWVQREGYELILNGHRLRFTQRPHRGGPWPWSGSERFPQVGMACSCGTISWAHTRELARLQWVAHTSSIRPERL